MKTFEKRQRKQRRKNAARKTASRKQRAATAKEHKRLSGRNAVQTFWEDVVVARTVALVA